jgi:hypothetical protein
MNEEIKKGSIVRYKGGWSEVRAVFKNTVNLGTIHGNKTKHKSVPISEVQEDYQGWHDLWIRSETYQCM